MEFEKFERVVTALMETSDTHSKALEIGIDLIDFTDPWSGVIQDLFFEVWEEEGVDWLNWFMWESDFGRKDWSIHKTYTTEGNRVIEGEPVKWGATDENGEPICYDIKSTWEYIKKWQRIK